MVRQLVDVGQLEFGQIQRRVKRPKFLGQVVQLCFGQDFLVLGFFHFKRHLVPCALGMLVLVCSHDRGNFLGFWLRFRRQGHLKRHIFAVVRRLRGFRFLLGFVFRQQDVRGDMGRSGAGASGA